MDHCQDLAEEVIKKLNPDPGWLQRFQIIEVLGSSTCPWRCLMCQETATGRIFWLTVQV
jgi:hypothetical protein